MDGMVPLKLQGVHIQLTCRRLPPPAGGAEPVQSPKEGSQEARQQEAATSCTVGSTSLLTAGWGFSTTTTLCPD